MCLGRQVKGLPFLGAFCLCSVDNDSRWRMPPLWLSLMQLQATTTERQPERLTSGAPVPTAAADNRREHRTGSGLAETPTRLNLDS
jgi:hypothetical protein